MSTPAQVGRNEYRAQIADICTATRELSQILESLIQQAAPSAVQAQAGRAVMRLLKIERAASRLAEIGRNSRELKDEE